MLEYIIPLIGCYMQSELVDYWFWPMVCLGIIYLTPSFIRSCFTWR